MNKSTKQLQILSEWVKNLSQIDNVVIVWIEGSIAQERGHPASDIDMRIAVREYPDPDYYRILLAPVGNYELSVIDHSGSIGEKIFVRVLTHSGIVIDLDIFMADILGQLSLPPHKILFSRVNHFQFDSLPIKFPNQIWPAKSISPDTVHKMMVDLLVVMTSVPSMFYWGQSDSAIFQLDLVRIEIIKLLYALHGISHFNRYKHMSELFSEHHLNKLRLTYPTALNGHSVARSFIYCYKVIGEYLELLSNQIGGGFDPGLYWSVYGGVMKQLEQF